MIKSSATPSHQMQPWFPSPILIAYFRNQMDPLVSFVKTLYSTQLLVSHPLKPLKSQLRLDLLSSPPKPPSRLKSLTHTDCRIFKFYSENFQNIRCGFEGSTGKCKKEPKERHVIEPVERKLKLNEKMIGSEYGVAELMEDVADRNCIGSDPDKYILNNPYIDKEKGSGYVRRGFVLTQCLGIQDKRYPYMYVLQSDGNFVSYDIKKKKAIWSTKSQGRGTKGSYSMAFQLDGNLVIYDAKGDPTWNSNTWRGSPDSFRVNVFYWYFKGGQMFLADSSGRNAWGTYPVIAHSAQRIEAKEADGAHSEYCLDLSGELRKCNGSKEQAFDIFTDGTIRNVASGQCLYASRPENATPISIGKCVVIDKSYLWQFPHIEGEFTQGVIVNQGAGKCLDNRAQKLVDGNVIQVFQCYDVWSEYWWIGGVP
ncbi:hypothetical protein EC991_001567 [Linnemannia zychae]|nr:hypothetical protein EC991_001567 [Linnemannia zychae]